MLSLTENATTVVRSITEDRPEAAGLRITADDAAGGALTVAPAASAEAGDQTVESNGATVFLDQVAAGQLDDKILDAGVDADGAVTFALAAQA